MEAPWLSLRAWMEGIDGGALALHFGKNTAQRSHPASLEKQPVPQALSRQPQALSRQPHSRSSQTTGLLSLLEPDSVLLPRKASSGVPSHSKLEAPSRELGKGKLPFFSSPTLPWFLPPYLCTFSLWLVVGQSHCTKTTYSIDPQSDFPRLSHPPSDGRLPPLSPAPSSFPLSSLLKPFLALTA
uniref:Uncharacterized protein n=1 Tax=Macaca fascicularis TaxID=9541 RepID=A0A7N9IEQ1_MACFA